MFLQLRLASFLGAAPRPDGRDVKPLNRMADGTFVLDSIGELEQRVAGQRDQAGVGRITREQPSDAEQERTTSVTSSATLAFLDLYLKDDPAARACLGSEGLVAFSGKKATLERK